MTTESLPSYDALPKAKGGVGSGWHLFGRDDSVGLMNLQTPERIAAAAKLVKRGALFSLNAPSIKSTRRSTAVASRGTRSFKPRAAAATM